jgi:hypothetical protein
MQRGSLYGRPDRSLGQVIVQRTAPVPPGRSAPFPRRAGANLDRPTARSGSCFPVRLGSAFRRPRSGCSTPATDDPASEPVAHPATPGARDPCDDEREQDDDPVLRARVLRSAISAGPAVRAEHLPVARRRLALRRARRRGLLRVAEYGLRLGSRSGRRPRRWPRRCGDGRDGSGPCRGDDDRRVRRRRRPVRRGSGRLGGRHVAWRGGRRGHTGRERPLARDGGRCDRGDRRDDGRGKRRRLQRRAGRIRGWRGRRRRGLLVRRRPGRRRRDTSVRRSRSDDAGGQRNGREDEVEHPHGDDEAGTLSKSHGLWCAPWRPGSPRGGRPRW